MQADELREVVRDNILSYRKSQRMTQTVAAQRAGVSQSHWARLEAGEMTPSLESLAKIANALGIHPDELLRPRVLEVA